MTTARPIATLTTSAFDDGSVVFDEVGENQWRVLNARVPKESVAALLGFVCVVDDVYEVTAMGRPLEISFCDDLRAAQAIFLDAE